MTCPRCGGQPSEVIDDEDVVGEPLRYRECIECGLLMWSDGRPVGGTAWTRNHWGTKRHYGPARE